MIEIADHIKDMPRSGIRDFFELVIGRDDIVSLGVGEPDFQTPWHIRESTIFAIERGETMYTSNLGLLSLREEIVKYVKKSINKDFSAAKESLITVGVSEALDIAVRAICNPGDEIIYHSPSYVSYGPTISMAFAKSVKVPTYAENDFNLLAEDLRKAISPKTKAILINFPNNPTGSCGDEAELREIAKIAVENDILVIVDEIYRDIAYKPFFSIAEVLPKENILYLNGFSKAYAMTGYRIGYACGPEKIIEGMMKIHQYSMLCASIIAQKAAIEALKNGDREKETMRKEYEKRRNYIVSGLNDLGLECFMPDGAFYVFPSVESTGLSGKEFATRLLHEENAAVVPGGAFGDEGEYHIRCAYAASLEEIEFALKGMKNIISRL